MTGKRIFVCRSGSLIIVRRGIVPPKVIISKLTKTAMVERTDVIWDPKLYTYIEKRVTVPQKIVLQQNYFIGGYLVKVIPLSKFVGLVRRIIKAEGITLKVPHDGKAIEVTDLWGVIEPWIKK